MINPNCVFRGSRTYLHSTTLLNHIFEQLDYPPRDIDFIFHKETANQCRIDDQIPDNEAQLIATYKDQRSRLYVVDIGKPIETRIPYDEAEVVSDAALDAKRLSFSVSKPGYTFTESLIAGYKYLLEQLFPEQTRKYAFARLRLTSPPEAGFEITHARIIAGKFYQGDISVEGQEVGNIYFGIW